MFDNKMISASIRKQKKKMMNAEPNLVDTDSKVDLNPMDLYNVDKHAQVEETVDSPHKINADETAMNEPYVQHAASKEPMQSHVNPKDHHKMAYGGAVPHKDAMTPSAEDERRYVAGSPGSNEEAARMMGNRPSVGVGEGAGPELGDGEQSEEKRRQKMRLMRLSSYLDSLDMDSED
jgi:hypothetical protein